MINTPTCKNRYLHKTITILFGVVETINTYYETKGITWIKISDHCCRIEVTGCPSMLKLLVVVIEGIRSMIYQCIREIARLIWLNLFAICSSFVASPIECHLQIFFGCLFISNAPFHKLTIY